MTAYRVAVLTTLVLLVGCGAPAGTPADGDALSAPPTAPASAASTPEPSTTPDPVAHAIDRLSDADDSIEMSVEGTLEVGEKTMAVSGDYAADGADFQVRIVFDEAGSSTEQIV